MYEEGTAQPPRPDHEPDDAIAGYALGALDAGEWRAVEAHLAECPSCRAELARQEAVVGELGRGVAPIAPRPELRASLLAEIRASAPSPAAPRALPRRVPVAWLGLAAAGALLSVTVLGLLLVRVADERDTANQAEQEIAEYLSHGGTLSPLVPEPGAPEGIATGHGSLAVAPDQSQAMLIVHGLDPSGEGRRYMAWAERDDERVRLGEVTVNDAGVGWLVLAAPEPMSTYETVGITRFSDDAPEGEPFLVASVE
jgi:hypothetical protein